MRHDIHLAEHEQLSDHPWVAQFNPIWAKAVKCSREVLDEIEEEKRFGNIHLSKAQIHAYLAWQRECGKPFGLSITTKYLQTDNPNCEKFVEWLKRLFVA